MPRRPVRGPWPRRRPSPFSVKNPDRQRSRFQPASQAQGGVDCWVSVVEGGGRERREMGCGGRRSSGAAARGAAHQYAALLPFLVQILLLFELSGTSEAKCWTPGTIYSGLCDQAKGNINPLLNGTAAAALVGLDYTADSGDASSSGTTTGDASTSGSTGSSGSTGYRRRRSLLWHGGGPEFLDGEDHVLGDNKRYRGDGGTLHDSDIGGVRVGERELCHHPPDPALNVQRESLCWCVLCPWLPVGLHECK